MRVRPEQRMTETITVIHRTSVMVDEWVSQTVEGAWQLKTKRLVASDGTVQDTDVLVVQIPEDQGDVDVAIGDYLYRGALSFIGTTSELVRSFEGLKKVGSIRDARGGLQGISGAITRYASSLILEADV